MRHARPNTPGGASDAPLSSRRAFLRRVVGVAGAGVLAVTATTSLAGCNPFSNASAEPDTDALRPLLLATVALGDRYETAMAAVPALQARLTPLRETHRAHAAALAEAAGAPMPQPSSDAASPPTNAAEALTALREAEDAARAAAAKACLDAPARLAPLLGSIAAARASHLEVLA